jgi:hypothetical protein
VLTLSLSILRGKAADNANLVMAGAAIAIVLPMFIISAALFRKAQPAAA